MIEVNGHTKQLGIIGKPVGHSFSPQMHNYISKIMGNNYVYSAWDVDDIENAIKGVRALKIRGVNVTAPYKEKVMPYLDEIDENAQLLGSVNTVVNNDGVLKGYNTDADGFYESLVTKGIEITGRKVLIIGAGGVVQPTVIRFTQAKPESITVVNRTPERAQMIKKAVLEKTGFEIQMEINSLDFDVVINTTSAGMAHQKEVLPTDAIEGIDNLDFINSKTSVVDMIYNPEETLFLKEARERGAKTVNGLGMLIYQGLIAYELFTETKLPADIYDKVVENIFKGKF